MSPVVVIGFGALDAALVAQAIYAYRDMTRPDRKQSVELDNERPN